MEELKEKVSKLVEDWGTVYENVNDNPQLWEQSYQDLTSDQVDELVKTLSRLFNRVRAPSGYSAGFEMAKSVAMSSLPNVEKQLRNLLNQQYNFTRNFVVQLNTLLAASLTLFLTSSYSNKDRGIASIANEVTAAASQANKHLNDIEVIYQSITERSDSLNVFEERVERLDDGISSIELDVVRLNEIHQDILDKKTEIDNVWNEQESLFEELKARNESTAELASQLSGIKEELSSHASDAKKIKATINGLLPGAASAGLASTFENRANSLKVPRYSWLTLFSLSMIGMIVITFSIDISGNSILDSFLLRVPFLLPLVWLGWFSAVQYGNVIRVEEDYRFKASTARAFVGYRDHMRHLKDIDLENADNVLALLSARTVEVLSTEPGRLMGKSDREAAPSSGFLRFRPKKSGENKE